MVAVVIAIVVAVAVVVAVAAALRLGAVEHERHVLELLVLVELLQVAQHRALHQAGTHHEDGAVGELLDDLRIGNHLDGRTVYEHIVVLPAHLLDELAEAVGEEQLGGVGRHRADGQDVEALGVAEVLAMTDDALEVVGAAVEIVAQALAGTLHEHGHGAVAEVTVDDQHPLLLDGQRHGDIGREEALARAGII